MDISTFVNANNGRNVINLKIHYVEWHFHGEKDQIHQKKEVNYSLEMCTCTYTTF